MRIVKENIGDEFATEVERICGKPSEELQEQIFMLENKNENLEERSEYIESEARKLFMEVLDLAGNVFENDEKEQYVREFDFILEKGDE